MVQYNRHIQMSFSRIEITTDDLQSNRPQSNQPQVKRPQNECQIGHIF